MTAIRQSTTQILPAAHAGKVTAADYNAFGDAVGKQVTFLVENCKLPPEADAQLHLIVAELVEGVEAAQGKRGDAKRAAGVVQIAQASNAYGKYFDTAAGGPSSCLTESSTGFRGTEGRQGSNRPPSEFA